MGIVLASNFDVKTNLALDSRTNKNTIEERNAIPTEVRFEGLECYVKEDGGLYRLTGGVENSNWSLIPYTDADGNLTIDGNLILNNSSTPINIKEYIDTLTAAGIHYIGTLDGTESSPGSFTPAAEVGDMYIVSTAGYINGVEVEVGDSILCHTDTEAADSSTYTSINSNWNYVQANISTMRGATSDTPGMSGIVPIPSAGSENKYLKGDGTWSSIAQSDVTDLVNDLESKADKRNSVGGFVGGQYASATSGGAVGLSASATTGGAVGIDASVLSGGAVGNNASATYGGAVGIGASASSGGAIGQVAKTGNGFAGGYNAKTVNGENNGIDAIQLGTGTNSTEKTLQVYDYQLMDSTGNIPLDRIQSALDESGISGGQETAHTHANKDVLDGISSSDITNWNNKADKQNSNGGFAAGNGASAFSGGAIGNGASATTGGFAGANNASATSGGAVGNNASATYGGAVGNGASATTGGAVGNGASATTGGFAGGNGASATTGGAVGSGAKTSTGFAGGYNAKTQNSSGDGIDAIQLGSGTNSTAKTLQVYEYQLMTANGQIPEARMSSLSSAKHTHSNKSTLDGISSTNITSWNNKVDTSDLPNIKKNSSSTSGDIISSHITIGSRGSGTYGSRTLFVGTVGRASGQSSANIGYNNTSSGAYSLTVGQNNTGSGQASGTFGLNSSTGNYSLTSGTDNKIGGYSVGMGSHISSPSNQGYCFGFGFSLETSGNNTAIGHHNKAMTKSSSSGTSGDAFVIGNGTDSATSNAFRVTYSGAVYGKSTYHSTGADYAEYFEWEDGNPNTEDRRGLFVTWGNDGLVKLANEGDEILGVVSVTPSVVGNAYEDDWQGMYQTDIFGQPLSHIVHHDAEYVDIEMPDVDNEGNELETTHIEHQLLHEAYDAEEYILNPEYDSEQEYIPRSDRKEWTVVGLMGQLIVIDDGSCTVNGYCTVGSNGTATTSDTGFKVLKRLDDTHIKVFIK